MNAAATSQAKRISKTENSSQLVENFSASTSVEWGSIIDPVLQRCAQEEAAAKSSDTPSIVSTVENPAANSQSEDIPLPSHRHAVLTPDQQIRLAHLLKSDRTKNDPVLQRRAQEEAAANSSKTPEIPQSIQAKLTVSTPGDKYEQEADAMAAKVMAMPDRAIEPQQIASKQSNSTTAALQRAVNEDKTVSPELENGHPKRNGRQSLTRSSALVYGRAFRS